MTIAAFLVAMVGPLLARMLTALGVSLITITGLVATAATLKTLMISNLNAVPMDGLELAGLFGVWTCIGLCLGSVTFVITFQSTKGFMALAKT
jgi:hypothetical protein